MKNFLIAGAIIGVLFVYFFTILVIFPQEYLSHKVIEPQPIQTVNLSDDEISLGDSFRISITTENKHDVADILISSIAFPKLQGIGDNVKILSYDYTQSPKYIIPGNKIGSNYSSGGVITAQYPSIEAYSRNVASDTAFQMGLEITPNNIGVFEMYVKTIAIPHTTQLSHYPYGGFLDSQLEYVSVFNVNVNP